MKNTNYMTILFDAGRASDKIKTLSWFKKFNSLNSRREWHQYNKAIHEKPTNSITLNGKVGINIPNESDTYALAVNGGILTNEVFIKNVDEWYDNVFAKEYNLLSLDDLKRFIAEHGHLPEVPSEAEVTEEGYNITEMQGVLLKKIEELTLYTLKQQEEIEMLKQTIEELRGKWGCHEKNNAYVVAGNGTDRSFSNGLCTKRRCAILVWRLWQ